MAEAKTVVARYFEMWNTGDTSAIEEILSPDWVDHAHPEVVGLDAVRQTVKRLHKLRPDVRFDIESILGDDGQVAVVGSVAGSATSLVWLVTVKAGLMTEMRTFHESHS